MHNSDLSGGVVIVVPDDLEGDMKRTEDEMV